MPRLFIGIPIPSLLNDDLDAFQQKRETAPAIQWTHNENRHITLYFFAEVPEEIMENLDAMLTSVIKEFAPFDLIFDEYVYAPPGKPARMIWGRLKKTETFTAFHHRIHQLYEQIQPGLQRRKSPIPHITLARLKRQMDDQQLDSSPAPKSPSIHVDKLVLWESVQSHLGSKYIARKIYELKAQPKR